MGVYRIKGGSIGPMGVYRVKGGVYRVTGGSIGQLGGGESREVLGSPAEIEGGSRWGGLGGGLLLHLGVAVLRILLWGGGGQRLSPQIPPPHSPPPPTHSPP